MKLSRKIAIDFLDFAQVIISNSFFNNYEKSTKLTIYNLHSTSEEYFSYYNKLLTKLNNKDTFLNPEDLNKFLNNKLPYKSCSLLTIDDGFKNNLKFAEDVLKPLNIKAIFFIIPKFINENQKNRNVKYFKALFPDKKFKLNKKNEDHFIPLNEENIFKLINLGHTIGMHGLKHENYGKASKTKILNSVKKGIKIFDEYDIKIDHFAYPFGDSKSFSEKSNAILKSNFNYIHLGIRGFNSNFIEKKFPNILKRHPISTHGKDLIYHPIKYKEINFFTNNKIILLSYFFKEILYKIFFKDIKLQKILNLFSENIKK